MGVLDGKVAIVTGAGTGLGKGIAQELAEAGAGVAVLEIDPESAAGCRIGARRDAGSRRGRTRPTSPTAHQVDEAFAAVVRDFGRLDIVVNNAGISRVGPHTQDVTDEDWHDSIAVMQTGVFYCMRAAGGIMVPQKLRLGDQHLVDSRLLAQSRAHDVLRAEGRGDHDDEGRCRRVGAAQHPRQRDRPGVLRTPMWDADVARGAIDEEFYVDIVPVHRLG